MADATGQWSELLSSDSLVLEEGTRRFTRTVQGDNANAPAVAIAAFGVIAGHEGMGPLEKARRVGLLLDKAALPVEVLRAVLVAQTQLGLPFGNTIRGLLPPHLRSIQQAKVPFVAENDLLAGLRTPTRAKSSSFRTVLLLGTESDHHDNVATLKAESFLPIRADSIDVFRKSSSDPDLCGVIVAETWWKGLPEEEHRSSLREILSMSSMLVFRVDVRGLSIAVTETLSEIQKEVYGSDRPATLLSHGNGCSLTRSDMKSMADVANLLQASRDTRFQPYEITDAQAELLRSGALKMARSYQGQVTIDRLRTGFLAGGKSAAKIAILRTADSTEPLVAKLDDIQSLRMELSNYNRYIALIDGRLRPQLHFHARAAALFYSLYESVEAPGSPAPTLENRVEALMRTDVSPSQEAMHLEDDLKVALERAADRIARMNAISATDTTYALSTILDVFRDLAAKGLRWNAVRADGALLDTATLVDVIVKRVGILDQKAVGHGDIHLRNILVNDNRDPCLIDFAFAGPSHPCYDLCRLQLSVLMRAFRSFRDERAMASLFQDAMVKGNDFPILLAEHKELLSCPCNRVAMQNVVYCRRKAIEVARKFGGDEKDYLAVQAVIAIHSLWLPEQQDSVARAVLGGVGPYLA